MVTCVYVVSKSAKGPTGLYIERDKKMVLTDSPRLRHRSREVIGTLVLSNLSSLTINFERLLALHAANKYGASFMLVMVNIKITKLSTISTKAEPTI